MGETATDTVSGRTPWRAISPLAVFLLVMTAYLATFTPSIWHPDALNYVSNGVVWARGDAELPTHSATYVGWEMSISALPAAHDAPLDILRLILGAKLLGIVFTALAAVAVHLIARTLFASEAFALLAAALFAGNPYVWLWGQGAMSDLPALAFMIFSFLCFIRFHRGRRPADLIAAAALAAVAAVFRLQSLIIFVPYAVGILHAACETPRRPFVQQARAALKLGVIAGAFPILLLYVVFGAPWEFQGAGLLRLPDARALMDVFRWYALRDMGWVWFLLAWSGLAVGLRRRESRPRALMLVAFLAVGTTYFASMFPGDTPRYLIPTVPFTLFGIGFLLPYARRNARIAVALFAAAHVTSVFVGLLAPPPAKEPSAFAKPLLLHRYLAADAAGAFSEVLPTMLTDIAMGAVIPSDAIVVMPEQGTLIERYVNMRPEALRPTLIKIKRHLPLAPQLEALRSLPEGKTVLVYPGLEDAPVVTTLVEHGHVPKGVVGGAELFKKPSS